MRCHWPVTVRQVLVGTRKCIVDTAFKLQQSRNDQIAERLEATDMFWTYVEYRTLKPSESFEYGLVDDSGDIG